MIEVDGLLASKRVSSFATLLAAYQKAGIPLHNAIDGGAGAGTTAKTMLRYLDGVVYAFEPFPGNHRFFADCDERIVLIPKALAEARKPMSFRVSSVVSDDSAWGQRGMGGYSSVGRLVEDRQDDDLVVECVRADDEIPPEREITFVKLDLQGGELDALKGMTKLLPGVSLMWVEFMGSMEILDHLTAQGFMIFDTEYFFRGEPSSEAEASFAVSQASVKLSTGDRAWSGFKRTPWRSFKSEFEQYRKDLSLGWTDLVCVNRTSLNDFQRAVQFL